MSQVLYRQYRPQKFSEVVNQQVIKTTIQNAVKAGSLAHAYLFTGPRGVGKTSVARILAKAVNCINLSAPSGHLPSTGEKNKAGASPNLSGEPCDKCPNCVQIRQGNFLDLVEIDAASHTGVDNIREIIEHIKFSPSQGKYKVIIIDEVHMLSKGAFNALLKTLEEPPAHAVFILATTEVYKVPATIVSRTQRFDFKQLSQADIMGQLKAIVKENRFKVPEEALKLIARAAEGSLRDALSLLDQVLSFGSEKISLEETEEILGLTPFSSAVEFFSLLAAGKPAPIIQFIKALVFSGKDLSSFVNGFLEYLDMVLGFGVRETKDNIFGLVAEDFEKLQTHSAAVSRRRLVRLADLFLSASQKLKFSPLPELPLELAAMEFLQESVRAEVLPAGSDRESGGRQISQSRPEASRDFPGGQEAAVADPPETPEEDATAEITAKWESFISKLREYNHSLISSLKLATIVKSDRKRLLLAFPYRFHKEAVEQRKNKLVVEKVLEETYHRPIKLECCLVHQMEEMKSAFKSGKTGGSLVDEAIKIFGISRP